MRRRAVRDIITIIGVILVLCGMIFANSQLRRGGLKEGMEKWRRQEESKRESSENLSLLKWDTLKKTRGSLKTGATFPDEVAAQNNQTVDIIGFMVPLRDYRRMTEFLLLPLPIQCYFCESPPARDVMLVQMREGEKVDLYEEPVLINGTLQLGEGPGVSFFYKLTDAGWGPAQEGATMHKKTPSAEHQVHMQMKEQAPEPLYEGIEPPAVEGTEPDKN